ncbi:MAG: hypothetical protein ACXW3N_07145, partial [Rhodoplanes sp.]
MLFELNDLSQAKPPADALAPEETFVGPIADESGLRFFLVFNELRIFLYTLDETTDVPDGFEPSPHTDRIIIGKRTGYAFYRDQRRPRKILIGVFFTNSRVNNYFDGPFDQLPDGQSASRRGRSMRRYALRDDQWDRIKDFLPGREGHVGGTAADNRLFVEAVLYRYR